MYLDPHIKRGRHGHATAGKPSKEYKVWGGMKNRCLNPRSPDFKYYGARGITVCVRWMKFENFLADMGSRPDGLTLGRIDHDKSYEPGNCRWETCEEQQKTQRRHGRVSRPGGSSPCH